MNIVEFCEKNNILWRPINVKVSQRNGVKSDKKLEGFGGEMPKPNDWKKEGFIDTILPKQKKLFYGLSKAIQDKMWIAIDTREIYQYDIDHLEDKQPLYSDESAELNKLFISSCPYYSSGTKALGKHAFFKLDKKLRKDRNQFQLSEKDTTFEDLEILSGQWSWSKSTTNVLNADVEIPTLNYDDLPLKYGAPISAVGGKIKFTRKVKKIKPEPMVAEDLNKDDKIFQYADIIKLDYLDDYSSWFSLLCALKSENKKSIAKYISSKSAKFNEEEFDKKWESIDDMGKITIGTIYHYAKMSDKKKYNELLHQDMDKLDFIDSDDTQANLFLREYEDNLVYKNGQIYIYVGNSEGTKGRWFVDEKTERVKKFLSDYLSGIQRDYLNSLKAKTKVLVDLSKDGELDEDQQAELNMLAENEKFTGKLIAKLKNCAKINSICERLRSLLSVKDFQEIKFDKNPYLFPFNNTCYCLKTHNWVGTLREQYILTTCGYDWKMPSDDEMKILGKLINEIFQDKDIRQEYIHYLATGLFGIPIEKFIFAFGSGGNGKGVINELMEETCGHFGYTGNNAILLNPVAGGANPAIANMSGKRFIIFREPDEKKSLNLSAIKEISGGKKISARKCFSNDDETHLCGTYFCETNKHLPLCGDLGASIQRRLRDIPFKTSYSADKEKLKSRPKLKQAVPYYKTAEFQDKFKFALFAHLINYSRKWQSDTTKNVCQEQFASKEVGIRTKEYIEDSDEIFGILKKHFVKDLKNHSCCVKFGEFWTFFKDSDFYKTLSKSDQNKSYSWKKVTEHLKESSATRDFYEKKFIVKDKHGQTVINKDVLVRWRMKTQEENEQDELENGEPQQDLLDDTDDSDADEDTENSL